MIEENTIQCKGDGLCLISKKINIQCKNDCIGSKYSAINEWKMNTINNNNKRKRGDISNYFDSVKIDENDNNNNKKVRYLEDEKKDNIPTSIIYEIKEDEEEEDDEEEEKLAVNQKEALEYALNRHNLFITGGAGCGKSYIIKKIKTKLEEKGLTVQVTATTGGAAWHIGGTTFHRFLGCGLAKESAENLIKNLQKNKFKCEHIRKTDVLIIDEVSMFDPELFVKFDAISKAIRQNTIKPFGGIQLILVGDFLQLPPVVKEEDKYKRITKCRYIFQTINWKNASFKTINLYKNFRQSDDDEFRELLNNARKGSLSLKDELLLKGRVCLNTNELLREDITRIFSKKIDVQQRNAQQLDKIKGKKYLYEGKFEEFKNQYNKKKFDNNNNNTNTKPNTLFENIPIENKLELKVGALVLLCCNLDVDNGLFNGTPGEVVGFTPQTKKENKKNKSSTSSIDNILAISSEEDEEEEDNDAAHDAHDSQDFAKNNENENFENYNNSNIYPIIKFITGEKRAVLPYTWEIRDRKSIVATYTNVPLILRYAITTHKAQGQTLPSAMIDMKCFENGQCYTALSRVKRLTNLYIIHYSKDALTADKEVLKFYNEKGLL